MCGDATNHMDMLELLSGEQPAIVLTDPPYGIDYADVKGKFGKGSIMNDDKNPFELVSKALENLKTVRAAFVCCNWRSMVFIAKAMEAVGMIVKSCIVWDKGSRIQNLDLFAKRHEFVLYAGPFGGEETVDDDVWSIKRKTSEDHPTTKPIELCARAIRYSTKRGEVICDPFAGSGSTLIAAETEFRTCLSMELEPKYCDVIIDRYCAITGEDSEKVYESAGKSKAQEE